MDKRRYARLVARVEVTIRKIPEDALSEIIPVVSKDISAAGIGLVSYKEFKPDELVAMDIKLPGEQIIHAVGTVKWSKEQEDLYSASSVDYQIGIEFTQISDSDRATLGKFVDEGLK